VRKCSASADHRVPFAEYGYVRTSAKGFCSHCKWKSVCFVLCRGHQRKDGQHSCHEQSAVGGHDHDRCDLRCWNSQRDGQYSERELWQSRLHERWKQPRSRLDDHVGNLAKKCHPCWHQTAGLLRVNSTGQALVGCSGWRLLAIRDTVSMAILADHRPPRRNRGRKGRIKCSRRLHPS